MDLGNLRGNRSVVRFLRALVVALHVDRLPLGFDNVRKAYAPLGGAMNDKTVREGKLIGLHFHALRYDAQDLVSRSDPGLVGRIAINSRRPATPHAAIAGHYAAVELLELDFIRGDLKLLADDVDDDRKHTRALIH